MTRMSETAAVLLPFASSREAMNSVPAVKGRKVMTAPVLEVAFQASTGSGMERAVPLMGRTVRKRGPPGAVPPTKSTVKLLHCLTSEKVMEVKSAATGAGARARAARRKEAGERPTRAAEREENMGRTLVAGGRGRAWAQPRKEWTRSSWSCLGCTAKPMPVCQSDIQSPGLLRLKVCTQRAEAGQKKKSGREHESRRTSAGGRPWRARPDGSRTRSRGLAHSRRRR